MNDHATEHTTNGSIDPITLEVIRHGIVSITDQIDANISRTAFSPYIYEYKDFAVGLVGADGELIAQCTGGMPGGGGGYGAPSERRREWVERDLRRGYVSTEAAARDYGSLNGR